VLSQDTAAGTRLPIAATIALTVSKGVARSAMPELVGSSAQAATVKLRALQLAVLRFTVVSDVPVGTVVSSFPAPGSVLRYGDQARLNISGGIPVGVNLAAQAVVPDLHGASNTEAQARLRERGVTPNVLYVRSHRAAGLVVRQSVAPGTRVRLGTIVGLDISLGSRGTAETPVPYIVGRARNAAVQLLRSTGFRVRLVPQRATARTPARTVLDEQPMGGTKAPVHAVVTLVIAA
jgi:eukaryotic-like serine/threonine-protein kinase